MAGSQPQASGCADWLESLGEARCERLIFDRFAEGITTRQVVEELIVYAREVGYEGPVVRVGLYKWQHRTPEREAAWKESLRVGAERHAEVEGELYDELAEHSRVRYVSREEVKITELKGKHRRWLASVTDRDRYGERHTPEGVTQVNVGTLHLTAAREVNQVFSNVFDRKTPRAAIEVTATEALPEARPIDHLFQRAAKPKRVLADVLDDLDETPAKPRRTLEDVLG